MTQEKLSVVLPTYNEGGHIADLVKDVIREIFFGYGDYFFRLLHYAQRSHMSQAGVAKN
jgi:glycosyltransferase involved in cell wall biosynthesis